MRGQCSPQSQKILDLEGLNASVDELGHKATYLSPKDGLILEPSPFDVVQVSVERFGLGHQVGRVHLQGLPLEFGTALEGGEEPCRLAGRGSKQGMTLGVLEKPVRVPFELVESA
jgi:hypothetical protein